MKYLRILALVLLASVSTNGRAQDVRVLGFSDVIYAASEADVPEGFLVGQVVGHAASGLTDRVAVFAEVSARALTTGYAVEVERLILRYEFGDFLKLSLGRYHTPVSYWNTAYHHGLWLQTTVSRPEYVKFGSQFVPVHFVGVLAEGSAPASPLGPAYFAGVGNGRDQNIARAGDAGDVNDNRAWLAGGFIRPSAVYGLQVGGAVYRDRIGTGGTAEEETILAAHAVWAKEHPELMAEYARITHDDADEDVSQAYYVQLAYRLPDRLRPFKPYLRLEQNTAPAGDPVFGPLDLEYDGITVGLRYDFNVLAALKVEYRNERFDDMEDRTHSLYMQVSFTFTGAGMEH